MSTRGAEMHKDMLRLSSFHKWPSEYQARPCYLASNGFYYTGKSDKVICCGCNISFENWTGADELFHDHDLKSPECRFTRTNTDERETEEDERRDRTTARELAENRRQGLRQQRVGEETSNGTDIGLQPFNGDEDTAQGSDATGGNHDNEGSASGPDNGGGVSNATGHDNSIAPRQRSSGFCPWNFVMPRAETSNSMQEVSMLYQRMYALGLNMRQCFPEFADESTRRETYRDWPIADIVHPRCLAHAGMFYSGQLDLVRCFWCGGRLRGWEFGDSPIIQHYRYFNHCDFAQGLLTTTEMDTIRRLERNIARNVRHFNWRKL